MAMSQNPGTLDTDTSRYPKNSWFMDAYELFPQICP